MPPSPLSLTEETLALQTLKGHLQNAEALAWDDRLGVPIWVLRDVVPPAERGVRARYATEIERLATAPRLNDLEGL